MLAPNNLYAPVNAPLFTHADQVKTVELVGAANVLLRKADALDRNRSEFVTKFPRLRLPSKDNIEENINYVVASPPTTQLFAATLISEMTAYCPEVFVPFLLFTAVVPGVTAETVT